MIYIKLHYKVVTFLWITLISGIFRPTSGIYGIPNAIYILCKWSNVIIHIMDGVAMGKSAFDMTVAPIGLVKNCTNIHQLRKWRCLRHNRTDEGTSDAAILSDDVPHWGNVDYHVIFIGLAAFQRGQVEPPCRRFPVYFTRKKIAIVLM